MKNQEGSLFDIVSLGIVTTDHLGVVEQFPQEDTKQRMTVYSQQGGGTGGTALVACSRLGLRAAYLGRLGTGPSSRFIIEDFHKGDVCTDYAIHTDGYDTPVAVVLVNPATGSRTIVWYKPPIEELSGEEIDLDIVKRARVLYLDAHETEASLAAVQVAKKHGALVVVDADNYTDGIDKVLPFCDVIIGSAHFGRLKYDAEPEQAVRNLFRDYGVVSIVTAGGDGSYAVTADEWFHQRAFPVEVVDTTGAGDVFHGAFVVGLLKGWNLLECMVWSSAVAAMKCRALGGRGGLPQFHEAVDFLSERGQRGPWCE